jgi:hypothetical protein
MILLPSENIMDSDKAFIVQEMSFYLHEGFRIDP